VKTVAVANNKGGVGKTSTAGSIGAALAQLGKRVLLVDLDEQCNLSTWLGPGRFSSHNVGEFLLAPVKQAATWRTKPVGERLELLPCHQLLGESLEKLREQKNTKLYYRLRDRLVELAGRFDYVVLDCPPSLSDGMTYNAFCAANAYLVPTDPEPFSVEGLARMMQLAQGVQVQLNPQLRFAGFVFPRYNPQLKGALRRQVRTDVEAHYGEQCVLGNIRQDKAMYEAQGLRQTVFDYAPDSRVVADYLAVTEKLIAFI
jgi:chromosome partitioning protein